MKCYGPGSTTNNLHHEIPKKLSKLVYETRLMQLAVDDVDPNVDLINPT